MKFLLSLAFFGFTICYGQHQRVEFPDSGATFRYLLITSWVGHFTGVHADFRHVKDTMVFDRSARRRRNVMVFEGDGPGEGYYAYASKDSSGAMWHCQYDDGEFLFFPWFDFNKGVGDKHWSSTVTKIGLIESQGISRKRMYLNNSKEPSYIEGVGDPNGFPFLFFFNGLISHLELLCFSVNDTVTYINPKYGNCDTTWDYNLSSQRHLGGSSRMVSAWGSNIAVTLPDEITSKTWDVQVFDAAGRRVLRQNINQISTQISLPVEKGVYMYALRESGQMVERGKVLIGQ